MIWVYAWTVVAAVLWLIKMIMVKKFLLKTSPLDLPIALFLISQILSTIFSIHPQTSIFGYYTRFHGGILSSFTYVFWYYMAISELNRAQLKKMLVAILISAAMAASYAIPEEFGRSFSCILANGQWTTNCWSDNTNPSYRIFGTFGQPNWLAAYLAMMIPLTWYFFAKTKQSWQKWAWLGMSGWLMVGLIYSKSRSGLLALAVAAVVWIIWIWLAKKMKSQWQSLAGIGGALAIVVALLGTTFTPSLTELWQKFGRNNESSTITTVQNKAAQFVDPGGTDSGEIRKIVWSGALRVAARYPWFGSGVETFAYSYYLDRPLAHNYVSEWDFLYNKAHNEFLNYLATTGVVGFASYLVLLGSGYVLAFRFRSVRPMLSGALLAGLSALYVSNFFGFSTVTVALLMHFFWAGLVINVRENEQKPLKVFSGFTNWGWLGVGTSVLMGAIGLNYIWKMWQADRAYATSQRYFSAGYVENAIGYATKAIQLQPYQAEFYSQLSMEYAALTTASLEKDPELASQLEQLTLTTSDLVLKLNPAHLNLYKNRINVLAQLAGIDQQYLPALLATINQAIALSPTDPKLVYNLARVELAAGNVEAASEALIKLKSLKSDYPGLATLEENIASASANI